MMAAPVRALVTLALSLVLAPNVYAEIVDLKWTGGMFAHKASISPKTFLEVCGKLKIGEVVAWQFKGNAPSDFNIHYHVGKDVTYPENRKEVAGADGTLTAPLDQDYCWMWSTRSAQPLEIEVSLKHAKPEK